MIVKKIEVEVELDTEQIAATLANEGSNEQADFLFRFVRNLRINCGSEHNLHTQALYVSRDLDPQTRAVLRELGQEEA